MKLRVIIESYFSEQAGEVMYSCYAQRKYWYGWRKVTKSYSNTDDALTAMINYEEHGGKTIKEVYVTNLHEYEANRN